MLGMCIANLAPTPILHFVIAQFSQSFAWISTILVLITSVFMWAEYRATLARPVSLSDDTLYLRYGTLTDRKIALSDILSARALSWKDKSRMCDTANKSMKATRYQGCGAANVELVLEREIMQLGLDEPEQFLSALILKLSGKCRNI